MSHEEAPAFPVPGFPDDEYFNGLSAREYAALKLRVPDSGTEWLDAMIRNSLRDDFAAKALQGMLGGTWPDKADSLESACRSYSVADDMLKARDA